MNSQKSIIFTIVRQFEPKHDVFIAWTRGRTFTKLLSTLINLVKSVIFTFFHRFERKHDVAHLQYLPYPFADLLRQI